MKAKISLIFAQLLGLFPARSLWGSKSFSDLQFKRLSLQMFYSWITTFIRYFLKYVCSSIIRTFGLSSEPFDHAIAINTFYSSFCTGVVYQALVVYRTKRFILLLKKIEEYDQIYLGIPRKKWCVMFTPFLVYNLIFLLATIWWPITGAVVGTMMIAKFEKDVDNSKYEMLVAIYANVWSTVLGIIAITIGIILTEVATLFPIIQLAFLVKGMEHRLEDICKAVEVFTGETTNPATGMAKNKNDDDLQLKLNKSPQTWSDHTLYVKLARLGPKKEPGKDKKFWSLIIQRYLDYSKLFQNFLEFSGVYFVVFYPMQIIAAVLIIYLLTATEIFQQQAWMQNYASFVITLSLLRIWGMCNLGHKLEKVHESLKEMILRIDECSIGDVEEKRQFERFSRIVESFPVQLKASGYFNVSRRNVPGIITAIVSYIIVLFQFKQAYSDIGDASLGHESRHDFRNKTD